MGMATFNNVRTYKVVDSKAYKDCLYCQHCRATFPNKEQVWGYASYDRDSTSGESTFWGGKTVPAGQCPFCGRTKDA